MGHGLNEGGLKSTTNAIENAMVSCNKIILQQHSQVHNIKQPQAYNTSSANASLLKAELDEILLKKGNRCGDGIKVSWEKNF